MKKGRISRVISRKKIKRLKKDANPYIRADFNLIKLNKHSFYI